MVSPPHGYLPSDGDIATNMKAYEHLGEVSNEDIASEWYHVSPLLRSLQEDKYLANKALTTARKFFR